MSYSTDKESNSLSLAMFASVGLHAVLFASMAFFPAASETVKKPLRIVNLLPPDQLPAAAPDSQAKTSTLEDILNNPLPDLSAGLPPLGNTSAPAPLPSEENTSSYVGTGDNLGNRVKTSLNWTNPPTQSYTPNQPQPKPPNRTSSPSPKAQTPSSIQPAPPQTTSSQTNTPLQDLPEIPPVQGAVPFPSGDDSSLSPGSSLADRKRVLERRRVLDQKNQAFNQDSSVPPSIRTKPSNLSESVPYSYPVEACPDGLRGTVTVSYYRGPDGSFTFGSDKYDTKSEHAVLNQAAVDAVSRYQPPGTGDYESRSARFDFIPSDTVCTASGNSVPPKIPDSSTPIFVPPTPTPSDAPATDEQKSDSDSIKQPDDESKQKSSEQKPSQTEQKDTDSSGVQPVSPQTPAIDPKPDTTGDRPNPPASQTPAPEAPTNPSGAETVPNPSEKAPTPPTSPVPQSPVPQSPVPQSNPVAPDPGGSASDLVPTTPPQTSPVTPPLANPPSPAAPELPSIPDLSPQIPEPNPPVLPPTSSEE